MSPAPQDAQMPREGEGSRSHDVSGERPRVGSPSSAEAVNPAEIVQAPGNDQDQVEVGAMLRMPSEPMMGFVMSPAPENSAGVDHTDEARAEDQVVVGAMLRMPSEHMMGFEMSPAPENTIWVDHADEARAEEISASDRELAEGSRAVTIRPAVDVRVLRRGPPPRSSDSGDAQTNRPVGFSLIRRPKPIKKGQWPCSSYLLNHNHQSKENARLPPGSLISPSNLFPSRLLAMGPISSPSTSQVST